MGWDRSKPLCLVGMSGVGKSYWSRLLCETHGFSHLDCDQLIAARLGELIVPEPGERAVHAVGRWMGMPWTKNFAEHEAQYLELEAEITDQALSQALDDMKSNRQVLDTTGSVVHLPEALQHKLRQHSYVVYLRMPPSEHRRMLELYLAEPKPVVWQSLFSKKASEGDREALLRCYPQLLKERDLRYSRLAEDIIDAQQLSGMDATHFLKRIESSNA
ncbi:MAG: hypothetical protein IPJ88_01935 [Myxococcales bacterium]|nr:MAG: hypothetical protein IPJ88_01935 [Myxococcales bacterium]